MTRLLRFLILTAVLLLPSSLFAADPPRPLRRVAILIGANDPAPGRQMLRYAQSDAQLMADVLERVGRFSKSDIHLLLEPRPSDVLAALDGVARDLQSTGGESLLVFYFSGHSDGQQVLPHGEPLALRDLRDRVARTGARVRVAILDTCHGGGWTRTKGLSVGPALDVADLMSVATEGSALLSSSSGLENAHEAAALNGSFFTHHVAAGLLGAADKSGDGNVTLQEVFEYAKERTVRDSARMAATTQHPSFDMQLRGRQDIVLAQLSSSSSTLDVAQRNALEVIHLGSGVTVVETPPGPRQLRLALVPGRYLVRRVADNRVYSKEVDVRPGATVVLEEGQLEATGNEKLALKDAAASAVPYSAHSTMARKWWELRFAMGATTGPRTFGSSIEQEQATRVQRDLDTVFSLTYGITDRLSLFLPGPALAYRFGKEGSFEVIPRAGLLSFGYSSLSGLLGTVDSGLATRTWLQPELSLISNTSASWSFHTDGPRTRDSLYLHASGGLAWNIGDRVTLAVGAGMVGDLTLNRPERAAATESRPPSFVLGSVQTLGFRQLPLVQIHLSPRFSLDGYASIAVDVRDGTGVRDRFLGGVTWAF